jgi:Fibronectin type III domain
MTPRRVVLTFVMCVLLMLASGASAEELRALGSFRRGAVLSSGAGFAGKARHGKAMALPFVVGASVCAESEPNDRLAQADPIANDDFCTGYAASGDSYDVSITHSDGTKDGIEDIFAFNLGYPVRLIVALSATARNTSSNHDLFLFSEAGGTLNLIEPLGNTGSNYEAIRSADVLAPGTYYIGVSAVTGSADYRLLVHAGNASSDTPPAAPSSLTATATSPTVIRLDWNDNANDETEFRVEQKNSTGTFVDVGPASANATTINVTGFSAGQTGTFRVRARNGFGNSAYSNEAWATTPDEGATCTPSSTTACLLGNRFRVAIDYRNQFSNPPGQTGSFVVQRVNASAVNPDTAIFGFGNPQDVEVVVRLVDARPFAPRFDVYYGGLTDVEYTVTVTDTQTGTTRQYHNNPGNGGGAVDRTSFPAN